MNKEKKKLLEIIDRFSEKKICVWGDFILDEYLYGNTRRISREAPVLILSYKNEAFSLGGAGNSLLNLKALGTEPLPVGVIGYDTAGRKIAHIMKQKGIPTEYLIKEKDFNTPIKTRIFAGEETAKKQQILRIDRDEKVPENSALKQKLRKLLKDLNNNSSALIISDYNYYSVKEDIFYQVLPLFKKSSIPIALDSRFRPLNFKGITVSTPNEPEVEEALRIEIDDNSQTLKNAGTTFLNREEAQAVLMTRGSQGMVLFEKGKTPYNIPIYGTTDIVDGTGAGDTVISVFTLALSAGATFKDAALLANYAGGIVVMKKGTSTLTVNELKKVIDS